MKQLLLRYITVRCLVAATFAIATLSISATGISAADQADLNLQRLIVSPQQLSTPEIQAKETSSEAIDTRRAYDSGDRIRTRITEAYLTKIVQGHAAYFSAINSPATVQIKLYEYVSHDWADKMRSKSTQVTPAGFPPKTRIATRSSEPGSPMAASAPRGRILTIITVSGIDQTASRNFLRHALNIQIDALPNTGDIDSSKGVDLSGLRIAILVGQIAILPIAGIFIFLNTTLRDITTLERFLPRTDALPVKSASPNIALMDITPSTTTKRRGAQMRGFLLLGTLTLLAAIAAYSQTKTQFHPLVELAYFPLLVICSVALTMTYSKIMNRTAQHAEIHVPPLLAVGAWLGPAAVIYAATFCVIAGLAAIILGTGPLLWITSIFGFIFGFRALRYAALPIRFVRRRVMPNVQEALGADHRPPIVFLRSFQDDDLLIRRHRAIHYNAAESATTEPFDRFEEALTWSLWRYGPVIAIGQPETHDHLQPLGAAREFHTDDDWQEAARDHLNNSAMIVFVVGRSPGLMWEIQNAAKLGLLGKCLFVIPPVGSFEAKLRIQVLSDALGIERGVLPYNLDSRFTVGVYFDRSGQLTVVNVDGRDDLAYQALVEQIAGPLIEAGPFPTKIDETIWTKNAPDESALLTFDPEVTYAFVPTVRFGLRYIVRSYWQALRSRTRGSSRQPVSA